MAPVRLGRLMLALLFKQNFKQATLMSFSKHYPKIISCVAGLALLAGCSGADEEQDTIAVPVNNSVTISGVALNGYLANALVWIDLRQNNTPDGFEPFAYTDNQGYFSYNPNTGVNYCESTEASQQRFCLQTGTQSGLLNIKAAKGIELLSGEVFRGVLSATIDAEQAKVQFDAIKTLGAKPSGDTRVWQASLDDAQLSLSPLSSLEAYLPQGSSLQSALLALGFALPSELSDADILSMDYIAGAELGRAEAAVLFASEVAISRLVDTLASNLDRGMRTLDLGLNGLPISSADTVYQALAQALAQVASSESGFRATLTSNQQNGFSKRSYAQSSALQNLTIEQMLQGSVEGLIVALADAKALTFNLEGSLEDIASNPNLSALLVSINNIAINHFAQIDLSADEQNLTSALLTFNQTLTLPTLTSPIAFSSAQDALGITRLASFMSNPNNRVTALLGQLTQSFVAQRGEQAALTLNLDLASLTSDLVNIAKQAQGETDLVSEQTSVDLTQLASVSTPDDSSFWAGSFISLSGIQDGSEQGQVRLYFKGQSTDDAGELIMCVAYVNDLDPSENINGQRFEGTWSVIGGDEQNRLSLVAEGFSIQMKALGESLGRDIPPEQQIKSLARLPNELYGKFAFTLNEDSGTWHSDDASINQNFGVQVADAVPVNSDECKALLEL